MVKFNSTVVTRGVTIGDWHTRPKTGISASNNNASDGDYFQATAGAIYRYSDDIGEWVRPFVYRGTPVLDAKITGKILPSAESPDGTRVTIDGNAKVHYDHGQTQKNHFIQGYYRQLVSGTRGSAFAIKDGVRNALMNLRISATPPQHVALDGISDGEWINQAADMSGHGPATGSPAMRPGPDRYYEMYFAASGSHTGLNVYIDHEELPSTVAGYRATRLSDAAGTYGDILSSAGSETIYFVGSEGATGAEFTLRDFFFGRY